MDTTCERCHSKPAPIPREDGPGNWSGMNDYCIHCSENLCAGCMASTKCSESPDGKHVFSDTLEEAAEPDPGHAHEVEDLEADAFEGERL